MVPPRSHRGNAGTAPALTSNPRPRARIITPATDTATAGEAYEDRLIRLAAERNVARGKDSNPSAALPTALPNNVDQLTEMLNNATGPLSGPGPRLVTNERLAEMDEERTVVTMSDGHPLMVWKADLPRTPQPNATAGARQADLNV